MTLVKLNWNGFVRYMDISHDLYDTLLVAFNFEEGKLGELIGEYVASDKVELTPVRFIRKGRGRCPCCTTELPLYVFEEILEEEG